MVPLGRTQRRHGQRVLLIEFLGQRQEVGVGAEHGTFHVAIAARVGELTGEGKALLAQTRVVYEGVLLIAVVTDVHGHRTTLLHAGGVGHDVDRTTYRGHDQLRSTQAALVVDAARHVRQAGPVGPVHPTVLHVVDGHTVDHHGGVALVEAAHVDAAVAKTATLLGHIDRGRLAQYLGELLVAYHLGDVVALERGHGHRRAAVDGYRSDHLDLRQTYGAEAHLDGTEVGLTLYVDGYFRRLVARVADHQRVGAIVEPQLEHAIQVGHRTLIGALDHDRRTDERLAGLGICHLALDHVLGIAGKCKCGQKKCCHKLVHN